MLITYEEMQRRLNSSRNLVNKLNILNSGVKVQQLPIKKHTPAANKDVKVAAATLVALGTPTKDVCSQFNLSPAQVYSAKDDPRVQSSIDRVRNLALDKMLIAMGLMTQEKFENATLKDLASSVSSLSRAVSSIAPKESGDNVVQFIVHAPQSKSLSQYKTIEV